MTGWRAAAAAALAVLVAGPAAAETVVAEYEGVAYGVLQFGHARVEATRTGDAYDASGSLNTSGIAVIFTTARARAKARGVVTDAGVTATHYTLDHFYQGVQREVVLDWSAPIVSAIARPPFEIGKPPVTEVQRRAGRDPLSTLMAMGADMTRTGRCAGTYPVFDGHFSYELTLGHIGPGRYRAGAIDVAVTKCSLTQRRVAGYASAADLAKKLPPAEIWFTTLPGAPFAVPARFTSRLPLGVASIRLTRFTTD